jgi:F0F1-type ATP synthase assembly protein I
MKGNWQLWSMSSLGFTLILCTVIGIGIGVFIDKYFHSAPFGTLIFFIVGTVAGFWQVYKEISGSKNDNKKPAK